MTPWSKDELHKIAEADDLHISPFREDGVTHGTPTWIWSVAVDGALYVRGYNGQDSRWYQAAVRQRAGRITAAGMTKEVTFEPVDGPINELIDDAYRALAVQHRPVLRSAAEVLMAMRLAMVQRPQLHPSMEHRRNATRTRQTSAWQWLF